MVLGIGVDLQSESALAVLPSDDVFFEKVFTPKERREAATRLDRVAYLTGRFAVKEAVVKAFAINTNHVRLTDVETVQGGFGQPETILHGMLKRIADERGIRRVLVSLSHDDGKAAAFAVLISSC